MSNPSGLCKCGCGQETRLAPQSCSTKGWRKGEPINYVWGHQNRQREPMTERTCTQCHVLKPIECFYERKTQLLANGGFQRASWCIDCDKARGDKRAAYFRDWRARRKEQREALAAIPAVKVTPDAFLAWMERWDITWADMEVRLGTQPMETLRGQIRRGRLNLESADRAMIEFGTPETIDDLYPPEDE